MWYTIDYTKDGQQKRIVSNWAGVVAFLRMNIDRDEYREVSEWIGDTFAAGEAWAGWRWPNGDMVEFYCPANETLPTSVNVPVVVNPLLVNIVTAIL